jgi:hypothetical protein
MSQNVDDGQAPPPSLLRIAEGLDLCPARVSARASTLDVEELSSYDLILAVDVSTLEQVRTLAAGAGASSADGISSDLGSDLDGRLLCIADFLSTGSGERLGLDGDRMEQLDDEMRALVAKHYGSASSLLELPSVYPSQADEWERLLAGCALSCAVPHRICDSNVCRALCSHPAQL